MGVPDEFAERYSPDRLCLMDLTSRQMSRICGADLVPPDDRRAAGLSFTASEVIENPYLIVEQYAPPDEDPIPFYRIDNGIFLPQTRGGASIPGLEDFVSNDRRRIRAAIFNRLREARARGHSFLPQTDIIDFLQHLQLPGAKAHLGVLTLAVDLDFFEEGLRLVKEGEQIGWMLPLQKIDEEEIRGRIAKLRGRRQLSWSTANWDTLLPSIAGLPRDLEERARAGHVGALSRLASQAFSVLVGGAGTGKTTVVATFIKALQGSTKPAKLLLLAPTGKAAVRLKKRVQDIAGLDVAPLTIHGYLVRNKWMDPETFRLRRDECPRHRRALLLVLPTLVLADDRSRQVTLIRSVHCASGFLTTVPSRARRHRPPLRRTTVPATTRCRRQSLGPELR